MAIKSSIAYTWDGIPLSEKDIVQVKILFHHQGIDFSIHAPFYQDPPPPDQTKSLWGLWNYEVVEFFLVGEDMQYLEAEFGPHGHHLLLWLDSPRNITQKHLPVDYHVRRNAQSWIGEGHISSKHLPTKILRWNLFSIHGIGENRQYHCMKPMQTPKPDFHQPHQFPFFSEPT